MSTKIVFKGRFIVLLMHLRDLGFKTINDSDCFDVWEYEIQGKTESDIRNDIKQPDIMANLECFINDDYCFYRITCDNGASCYSSRRQL